MHQNIAGILSKLDLLEAAINELQSLTGGIDFICLSETFVKSGSITNITINNYKVATSYCRQDQRRGGTCILIKNNIEFKTLDFIQSASLKYDFEACGVEIPLYNMIILCIYRTPTSNVNVFFTSLSQILQRVTKYKSKHVVICGDWNIDFIKESKVKKELTSILSNYNLKNHIICPTRKKSCIDLIASNISVCTPNTYELDLSDHETCQVLSCNVHINSKHKARPQLWHDMRRDFSKDNMRKFNECMSAIAFTDILNETDTNTAFNAFHELVILFYNLCFPWIKIIRKNKPIMNRWLTKGIKVCCANKRKLRRIVTKHSENRDIVKQYKTYTRVLKSCLHKSRQISNYRFIRNAKNVCKASWQLIKNNCAHNVSNNYDELIEANKTNPVSLADKFNDFFIELTNKKKTLTTAVCPNIQQNINSLFLSSVSSADIQKAIKLLNNTNSTGYDGICTNVIKSSDKALAAPLAHIMNISFLQGVFPERLKYSVIKPLHKKGPKTDLNNYRPVTLIPVISKIFEKVMYDKIMNFVTKNNILVDNQFGFRKNSSTALACFHLVREVIESLDKQTPIVAIFLDMSKAFDFVDHAILLSKLYKYGVRGPAWDWIASYLKNRKQCVEITQFLGKDKIVYKSSYKPNMFGVPQGSILGPLLFLLYINDLPNATSHNSILFADDTTLLIKYDENTPFEYHINKALQDIIDWLDANNLHININKTKMIQFQTYRSKHIQLKLKYNGSNIEEVNSVSFLGLSIDRYCNWKSHVDNLRSKLDRFVYALYRIRNVISEAAALSAYHGYVSSLLRYGLILWGNSADANVIFKTQKKCLRALSGVGHLDHCRSLFINKRILTLPSMYVYEICNFVKKHPTCFKTMTTKSRRGAYRNNLYMPMANLALSRKNVHYMATKIFNIFTDDFKALPLTLFKKLLFDHLIKNGYYSIEEFITKCNL
jgi:exonuclease III